jgi:hypothetical protein
VSVITRAHPFASDQALEVALTLAGTRALKLDDPDETIVRRFRFEVDRWALALRRRYRIGETASADVLTVEEARYVLEMERPSFGEIVEVCDHYIDELELWLAMVDSRADIAQRTAKLTGVDAAEVERSFRVELEVDLERRTLGDTPWRSLPVQNGYFECRVVADAGQSRLEMTRDDARQFDPGLHIGDTLKIPSPIRGGPFPWRPSRPIHENGVRSIESPDPAQIEALRSTASPVPTPAPLTRFDLGPLRQFYPAGQYGVLWADLEPTALEAAWRALDKAAKKTGYRPVLLHGERRGNPAIDDLVVARFAWSQDPRDGLQSGTHRMDSPTVVLAEADTVDVPALLAPGGNPSYPDWRLRSGGTRVAAAPRRALRAPRSERVRLVLVPAEAAWQVIAYLPIFTTAGEATPSLAQAVAVSREWERRWGARVASVGPATIEWIAPPLDLDEAEAVQLAIAHHAFTPEAFEDETLGQRASALVLAESWYAWWD